MEAYDAAAWSELFVAVAGASAALAGLLFVAISINVDDIVADRSLPGRAVEALIFLVGLLVVATVCLFPGQAREVLGVEVLVIGVVAWALPVRIQLENARRPERAYEHRPARALMAQLATLPYVIAGVSILVGEGGGLYWVGLGAVLTFTVAATAAWVLLIEIKR
jgi:modulator of FtsH protease